MNGGLVVRLHRTPYRTIRRQGWQNVQARLHHPAGELTLEVTDETQFSLSASQVGPEGAAFKLAGDLGGFQHLERAEPIRLRRWGYRGEIRTERSSGSNLGRQLHEYRDITATAECGAITAVVHLGRSGLWRFEFNGAAVADGDLPGTLLQHLELRRLSTTDDKSTESSCHTPTDFDFGVFDFHIEPPGEKVG